MRVFVRMCLFTFHRCLHDQNQSTDLSKYFEDEEANLEMSGKSSFLLKSHSINIDYLKLVSVKFFWNFNLYLVTLNKIFHKTKIS
jgi:hypothetical protein